MHRFSVPQNEGKIFDAVTIIIVTGNSSFIGFIGVLPKVILEPVTLGFTVDTCFSVQRF